MPSYSHKDKIELAFDANKKRLRTEGAILLQELLNEALNEMSQEFNDAISKGEILEISGNREEMKRLLFKAAQKQLGPAEKETPKAVEWGDSE